jgi:CysZ protein
MISTTILAIAYWALYYLFFRYFTVQPDHAWYFLALYYAAIVIMGLLLIIIFFFFFNRLAAAIAAPFSDLISQKTEQIEYGTFSDTPFTIIGLIRDSSRAIRHSFKILGLYLALLVGSLLLLVLPGIGPFLFSVSGALLSAFLFAYEFLSYPMDRRKFTWMQKKEFLKTRLGTVMGFGLGCVAVAAIPVINILFIPSAAIGGTLLFLELQDSANVNKAR